MSMSVESQIVEIKVQILGSNPDIGPSPGLTVKVTVPLRF